MLLALLALGLAARGWVEDHPQHNPFAPLDIAHPPGWATGIKLAALREDVEECRAVLERGGIAFDVLPSAGDGQCARTDRTVLRGNTIAPASPQMTCPVAAALHVWLTHSARPAAEDILGSPLVRIEHMGTFNCRRIGGGESGNWSEHASGNAIDIAAFVLEDGRRISLTRGWDGPEEEQVFLRTVRDGACASFSTVLSPAYNAAHADHFHFDQAPRMIGGVCR
ncbi:extensin-like domain-containing protein [Alteraurantiacibacter palmitatis]|uniref:Extensin family protein n=2 Tax=Alteraurantiacibacter palmitatis TaxID=2054628 RepID=A0ABV7E742_9SPHN